MAKRRDQDINSMPEQPESWQKIQGIIDGSLPREHRESILKQQELYNQMITPKQQQILLKARMDAEKMYSPEMRDAFLQAQKITRSLTPEQLKEMRRSMDRVAHKIPKIEFQSPFTTDDDYAIDGPDMEGNDFSEQYHSVLPDDEIILKKYLELEKPSSFEECIKCVEALENMLEIRDALIKAKDAGHTVLFHGMELDFEEIDRIEGLIRAIKSYLREFQECLPNYDLKTVERNLDYLCARKHITRNQLERILGLSTNYFARVLNPGDIKRRMSVEVLNNVCKLFGVSMDRFLSDDLSKTMTAGISKACWFVESLIDMTEGQKIHWNSPSPIEGMSAAVKQLSIAMWGAVNKPVEVNEAWKAATPAGEISLAHVLYKDGKENYRLAIESNNELKILFETEHDSKGELLDKCRSLQAVIKKWEVEFYLAPEAAQAIDDFMDALDNVAAEEGRQEYINNKIAKFEELKKRELEKWVDEEVEKQIMAMAQKGVINEQPYDEKELRNQLREDIQKNADKVLKESVAQERIRLEEVTT